LDSESESDKDDADEGAKIVVGLVATTTSEAESNETNLKAYCECIKEGLKTFFVPEGVKMETMVQSEPEASSSKAKITSKPKNFKPKVSKTSKIKIMKRS